MANTVITYFKKDPRHQPPLLSFCPLLLPPSINFHRHRSVVPELFSSRAATFSSCQVAWRFPCHRLAGWSCCGSCLPLRDVHLEWGPDRPDSPSPQGLCHVIQASLQALSSTPLFPYTNEGMGLAFSFFFGQSACNCRNKEAPPTPTPLTDRLLEQAREINTGCVYILVSGYLMLASVSTLSQLNSYIPLFSPCVGCTAHF